jgi:catechol 2,3-dioxygenase-like lactoylglutathione lyase family enzyme
MTQTIEVKSLAPILVVDEIEPVLPFWVDRLGFALVTTVPEASPFHFAIVARDNLQVMLQTRGSASEDLNVDMGTVGTGVVYISVAALDPVVAALGKDADVAVARRKTFYGADEIFVRDPAGNLVGLAAFA